VKIRNMNKTNSESKLTDGRRPGRSARDGRTTKIAASEIPGFLVRLVGWRRLKAALTETMPRYRHD